MLQNTPHEVYVYTGCAPNKLYCFVCGADTPKQDACYCEFYKAVNFVVHDTVTISYLTAVRKTVAATNWGHKNLLKGSAARTIKNMFFAV